jgi:hypothetical protein
MSTLLRYTPTRPNQALQPTALWRCASMSSLIIVFSTVAQPRSRQRWLSLFSLDLMRTLLMTSVTLLLVACGKHAKQPQVVAALEKLADAPSKMVLYSLNPEDHHDGGLHTDTVFHSFGILGKAEITDTNEQRSLLRALARGASENDDHAAACFNPRHALHVEQNGQSLDFTICFECLQVETQGFQLGGFLTSDSPQATFDQSLQKHQLPLASK